MPLWIDAFLIIVLALLIDRYIGELPNSVHPLRWMGNLLGCIDWHVRNRASFSATAIGFLSYLLVFLLLYILKNKLNMYPSDKFHRIF